MISSGSPFEAAGGYCDCEVMMNATHEIDDEVERLNKEKEEAVANQDFEKAASLRDSADKLKKKKESINREWRQKSKEVDGVVDGEVIAEVVAKMTGVPLKKVGEDETQRLLKMEQELHGAVISQGTRTTLSQIVACLRDKFDWVERLLRPAR